MSMSSDNALAGFTKFAFDDGRWTRPVYRIGSGPGGDRHPRNPRPASRWCCNFARDVAAEGMTVFCPSLFGEPGKPVSTGYALGVIAKTLCVRREFNAWAADRSSPIVDWLRALARKVHAECGGKGVGAVGMCFTGGFALAMMTEPSVVAPVLSQPSLPLGKQARGGPGLLARRSWRRRKAADGRRGPVVDGLAVRGRRHRALRPLPDPGAGVRRTGSRPSPWRTPRPRAARAVSRIRCSPCT